MTVVASVQVELIDVDCALVREGLGGDDEIWPLVVVDVGEHGGHRRVVFLGVVSGVAIGVAGSGHVIYLGDVEEGSVALAEIEGVAHAGESTGKRAVAC